MTGEMTDSDVIAVDQPMPGVTVSLVLEPGKIYKFNIAPHSWRGVTEDNGILSIAFDNSGTLILENFSEAMEAEIPAGIVFNEGQYLSLEEFSYMFRLAESMSKSMREETPQPAVISVGTAEELSGIEPAVGGETSMPLTSGLLFLAGVLLTGIWMLSLFKKEID